MTEPELTCQVCGLEPAVGVAAVPGIPCSIAYGKTCLQENAHPCGLLRANVACCGGVERTRADYLDGMNVWLDGGYMTLREALTKYPLTEEDLNFGPDPLDGSLKGDPDARDHDPASPAVELADSTERDRDAGAA